MGQVHSGSGDNTAEQINLGESVRSNYNKESKTAWYIKLASWILGATIWAILMNLIAGYNQSSFNSYIDSFFKNP